MIYRKTVTIDKKLVKRFFINNKPSYNPSGLLVEKIIESASNTLKHLDLEEFGLDIVITDNLSIKKLNKQHRNINRPTDILSLQFHNFLLEKEKPFIKEFGTIYISYEYILNDYKTSKLAIERIYKLIVHGMLHLYGYDHENEIDFNLMRKKEIEILGNNNSALEEEF